jgi:transposase
LEERNRPSPKRFSCVRCGFQRDPDLVAAWNIRERYEGLWAPAPNVPGRVTGPNASIAS